MSLFVILLGFFIANFTYQYMTNQDWELAFERSYFQCTASVITWWLIH